MPSRMAAMLDPIGRTRTVGDMIYESKHLYPQREHNKDRSIFTRLDWWEDNLGTRKLVDVEDQLVREYRQTLTSIPNARGKLISRATSNRYLAALSTVYSDAIEWGWVKVNPCTGIRRGGETHRFGRSLDDDELGAPLEACKASSWPQLYSLVLTAVMTGACRGELMALTWGDVDLKVGTAILRDSKNGESRTLALLPPVVDALINLVMAKKRLLRVRRRVVPDGWGVGPTPGQVQRR